jgi:hypothetical protein
MAASANDNYPEYDLSATVAPRVSFVPVAAETGATTTPPATRKLGGVEIGVIAVAAAMTVLFASLIASTSGK